MVEIVGVIVQVVTAAVAIVALYISVKANSNSSRIALSSKRIKSYGLYKVLVNTLKIAWKKLNRGELRPGDDRILCEAWMQELLLSQELHRILPKSYRHIWDSPLELYNFLQPYIAESFEEASFYFDGEIIDKFNISELFGDVCRLVQEECAEAKNDTLRRIQDRVLQNIAQLEKTLKKMRDQMRIG